MRFWSGFRRFWLQEEIPRWIGLSLVVLLTAGMGTAAWSALTRAERESQAGHRAAAAGAANLLSKSLAAMPVDDTIRQRCLLRDFARDFGCTQLRIVDRRRTVLASISRDEIGEPSPCDPQAAALFPDQLELTLLTEAGDDSQRLLCRMPIDNGSAPAQRFLEGVMVAPRPLSGALAGQVGTLTVILVAVGVLFLLYRRMREHFRGMAHIADNLSGGPEILAHELDSLRVADSLGAVATTWNSLIDLVEELRAQSTRSAATDELRRALERTTGGELAEALNALPEGLMYLTDGETVRYANSKAAHLLGWQREADEGQSAASLSAIGSTPLAAQLIEAIQRACKDGVFASTNEVLTDEHDGSAYRVRTLPLARRRGGECVVVIADISQQIRADRAREDFVSQVTHELRTPLTNIRAYAETLSSGMFDDPKVITDCYNVITKETRRLSRLIEDILSISQMEAGNIKLVEDDVDVRQLVSDAVRDVRGLADEKNIDLQMDLPAKLGTTRGDRDKLAVVLNNLLGNALKYTPSGGAVRLGCKMTETELMISVKDNGIGIDPANHVRIFEKFQRGDDPEVQDEPGTGIGLTTAREIARCHGGDIELMSAKGEGSTFLLKIPVVKRSAAAAAAGL